MADGTKIGAGGGNSGILPGSAPRGGKRSERPSPSVDELFLDMGLKGVLDPGAEEYEALTVALLRDAPPEVAAARVAALQKIREKLLARASDGRILGKILAEHARDPAHVRDVAIVIGHLAGDVPIVQGSGRAACAAAALQKMLAQDRPGEYARVALELVTTGRTTVGKKEYRAPEAMADAAGRSEVSLVFQETFLRAVEGGKDGVQARKLSHLYGSFQLKSLVAYDTAGTARALDSGKPVAVVIRLPGGRLHAVLAQKTKEGEFYYDPARGGERFPLDRGRIAGEVSYAAAALKILREEPDTFSWKTARLVEEVIAAGVGLRGIEDLSPEAQARLREATEAYNQYLPQDPVGDGSGGVAGAEETGSWSSPRRAPGRTGGRYAYRRSNG